MSPSLTKLLSSFRKYRFANSTQKMVRTTGMIASKRGRSASLSGKIRIETPKGINQRWYYPARY